MSSNKSKMTKLITLFRGTIFFGFSERLGFFPLYMHITTWIMNLLSLKRTVGHLALQRCHLLGKVLSEFTRDNRQWSKWHQELYFDVIMAIINMSWLQQRNSYFSNPLPIFGSTHGWVTLWGTWSVQKSMGVIELRFPKAVTPRLTQWLNFCFFNIGKSINPINEHSL